MNAREIFEKLVDKAAGWSWRLSSSLHRKPVGKPGELVSSLPPEEREALKNFTAEDMTLQKMPRNLLRYMIGTYPESDVRVFSHSTKKE